MRTSPAQLEVDAGDLALRMQERALHLFRRADEALAGAGQLRAGRAPIEQFRAERRLERRDAAADRRVVELQPLGGGDELPGAATARKTLTLSQSMRLLLRLNATGVHDAPRLVRPLGAGTGIRYNASSAIRMGQGQSR